MRTHTITLIGFGLGLCLLLGAGILWLAFSSPTTERASITLEQNKTSATTTNTVAVNNPYADPDNDGLPNWQEALWNTDPKNPDTNNDGISDGEEVREGKNPLTGIFNDQPLAILRTLISNNTVISQVPVSTPNTPVQNPPTPTVSIDANVVYGNSVALALNNHYNRVLDEASLMNAMLTTGDSTSFTEAQKVSESYEILSSDIKNIPEPSGALLIGQSLATAYSDVASTLTKIIQSDSTKDIALINNYNNAVFQVQTALIKLVTHFQDQHTVFGPNDPGRIFTTPTN